MDELVGDFAMRGRIGAACLATAAVLAIVMAALAPSGAAAATPEFKVCFKAQPAKSGKYASNTCSEASFVAGGGQKFEREGFPFTNAKKQGFTDGGHGSARWTIVNPIGGGGGPSEPAAVVLEPKCPETRQGEAARGGGTVTGPKSVIWRETYKECSVTKEGWKCTGGTNKKNHIVTEQVEGTLVYLNAAHTRVGFRVKGLGPGGELMSYSCPAGHLTVKVFGEYLTEITGDINSASKPSTVAPVKGSLGLQDPMYEEEAFSEAQGKEVLEYDFSLEACEKGEAPFAAGEKSEAECVSIIGPAPAAAPPITLTAVVTGAARERYPMTQQTTTTHIGGLFLVETS